MMRHILTFLLSLCLCTTVFAQQDSINKASSAGSKRVRISLITCGMGNEEWQTFGHTTLRVIDSNKTGTLRDVVYNYGTFGGFGENFEWQFFTGSMTYMLQVVDFDLFMTEYVRTGRGVAEQVLVLDSAQSRHLISMLEYDAQPMHRNYQYDVFYNNCCTKVRDLIANTYGAGFVYGQAFPPGMHVSLRAAYGEYYRERPWERVGLNIVIGSPADTIISNNSIMFIPDFLSKCAASATWNGKKVFRDKTTLLEDHINQPAAVNAPFILTCLIALLTILGLSVARLRVLGRIMTGFVLLVCTVFGCLIIFFWFFSEHTCAKYNFNILWALPTNLLLPFINYQWKKRYALTGMVFIFVCLLLHVIKLQVMPLFELGPFLLALLWVYGYIYRESELAVNGIPSTINNGKKNK